MPEWRGPLLLMTGRQDVWSPIAAHEDIARLCPQAQLEIIDGAGHFAPVEQPAKVAGLLAEWVCDEPGLLSLELALGLAPGRHGNFDPYTPEFLAACTFARANKSSG
jgi:hypothetical protein